MTDTHLGRGKYDRTPTRCAHCRRMMSFDRIDVHVQRCPYNPDWMPIQRAALDDGTGTIRSMHNYASDSRGALSVHTLTLTFATWAAVAAHFGLAVAVRVKPDKRTLPKRTRNTVPAGALRDDERLAEIDGEKMEALHYHSPHVLYGPADMPVCRVVETDREIRCVLR